MSASLEAQLRLDISQYQAQLAKARGEAKKFKDQLSADRSGKSNLGDMIGGSVKDLLPAIGVAAVVGGVRQIMGEMDDLADTALRLGESTETLQRVGYAANLMAGVDLNGVTSSFLKLEKALGDVENKAASKALERYGVTAAALTRLPLDEKILVLSEAFQKARASGTGYNDLLNLLGKSAGELIPLLTASKESINEMFADAPVLADAAVQQMAALNDKVDGFLAKTKAGAGAVVGLGASFVKMLGMVAAGEEGSFAKAFASPDEKPAVEQEAARAQKAAALEQARAKAEAEAAAAQAIKDQARARAEAASYQEKEGTLAEKRMADYLSILPPNLKLIELKREALRLESEQAALTGPGFDERRLQIESALLDLRKQSREAESALADEKARALEKQKEEDAKTAEKAAALAAFHDEMDLINAKVSGNKKLVSELENQAAIQEIQADLVERAGLSEAEALEKAKQMSAVKRALAEKEKEMPDKEGSIIKGYSRQEQGGITEARSRAEQRLTESAARTDRARENVFGSLAGEDSYLKNKFAEQFGPQPPARPLGSDPAANPLAPQPPARPLGSDPAANPLAPQAAKNTANAQAAANATQANPTNQIGTQILQILQQMLPALQ